MRFNFGFAVVYENRLVLFRVQDHLRKMGLARQALRALVHQHKIRGFNKALLESFANAAPGAPFHAITDELRQMSNTTNLNRFEQLLRSVEREPQDLSAGAAGAAGAGV
jgi:hypothetical protein